MRVVFMGSSDFAVPALNAIFEAGHEIAAVYCQPPRPAGRGMATRKSPVHGAADMHGLRIMTPVSLRSEGAIDQFLSFAPDVAVVASYGLLLPKDVLNIPLYGCLNIHASLLPRWRGASPIQYAIWKGDEETGVTIMQMDEGLDTGPILLQRGAPIGARDTAGDLHRRLAILGARLIGLALRDLDSGQLMTTPQDEARSTYAPKLEREDGHLDWRHSASELERQVRAFNPWPGTWVGVADERLIVIESKIDVGKTKTSEAPGTLQPGKDMVVRCGDGNCLTLLRVKRPGRNAVSGGEYRRGMHLNEPVVLS